MNYKVLEHSLRQAFCHAVSPDGNLSQWVVTRDANEGIATDELPLHPTVELFLEPTVSPFAFFCGEEVLLVAIAQNGQGSLHVLFGNGCRDAAAAREASEGYEPFGDRFGWSIAEDFGGDNSLHLFSSFHYSESSEESLTASLTQRLLSLTDERHSNRLRPFIHYFEN